MLDLAGCRVTDASLSGAVSVAAERPAFSGPLRVGGLACAGGRLADGAVQIDARADSALDGGEARLGLVAGALAGGGTLANGINGTIDATWRRQVIAARYDGIVRGLVHPQLAAATVSVAGQLRARSGLARIDAEGALDAGGLRPGAMLDRQLAGYEKAAADTLLAPLLQQVRTRLDQESRGSRLRADYMVRRSGQGISLTVPQGRLTGGSGATLLALSRLHYASGPGAPRLAGNFATSGAGLPAVVGRLEQGDSGRTRVHMTMADFRAGQARLAVPELVVDQARNGALVFTGRAVASGPLPGGQAANLAVPLDGARSAGGVLTLWRACIPIAFDRLVLANLELDRRSLRVCPAKGGAIVRSDGAGTRIAAGTPSLDLTGRLGATPVRIASGPMGIGAPGVLYAKALDVTLGPPASASRFRLAELKADVGREIAGSFAGTDLSLYAVPLDLLNGTGQWRYADGRLSVSDASFRLADRAQVARFQPLEGAGATLSLQNNRIVMNALLREPQSRHEIVKVAIEHDLASARGHADLAVEGIVFDKALQPDMLTRELLGVVANTRGTVRGAGRIDWAGERVTSTGHFSTDSLDFAAALGPVRGVAGEVRFTDLIGLVTPPGQRLTIASINPGIEVLDGVMTYQLRPGSVVAIEGGSWPLLGGTLQLHPTQ
ncbi:MAG TPA: C4-dicarboxylate ABC transporter, partial [Novosphingobium sp.]